MHLIFLFFSNLYNLLICVDLLQPSIPSNVTRTPFSTPYEITYEFITNKKIFFFVFVEEYKISLLNNLSS